MKVSKKSLSKKGFGNGSNKIKKSQNKISNNSKLNVNIKRNPFVEKMDEIDINFSKEELQKELESIDKIGKELMRKPNLKLLEEYKNKIKFFLKEALDKIYKITNKKGIERLGGEQKVYINLEQIDKKLEEITFKFINDQQGSLNIIREIEGIQGLLCNIIA
ncbi:MAG: hypothetical protein B6I28_05435 [Fusobacteriia bacterium 4572_132]|nr:MAG: hypothetical protein B6I28_05435 [Fusobacteriia bacterium 4572_132]